MSELPSLDNYHSNILLIVIVVIVVAVCGLLLSIIGRGTVNIVTVNNESFIVPFPGQSVLLSNRNLSEITKIQNNTAGFFDTNMYSVNLPLGRITWTGGNT
jgi:hypothetical protein